MLFVVICEDPTPENGQISQPNTNGVYPEGSTVSFTCDYGYRLSESASSTCNATGVWNPDPPLCLKGTSNLIENMLSYYSFQNHKYSNMLRLLAKQYLYHIRFD